MDSETTSGNKRARFASLDEEELTQFAERQKSYKKLRKDTPSPEENARDTDSDVGDIPLPLDNFFSEGSDQGSDLKRNDKAIEDLAAEENASDTDSIETILYEYYSVEKLRDVDDIPLPLDNFFSEGSDQGSDLKRNDKAIEDLAAEFILHNFFATPPPLISSNTAHEEGSNRELSGDCLQFPDISQQEGH